MRVVPILMTAGLVAASIAVASPASADAPYPRPTPTPSSTAPGLSCGDTVVGSVRLDSDLTCAEGPGLVLTAGSALDLGGHVLTGPGSGTALEISPDEPFGPVTVRNGTVRDWASGVVSPEGAPLVTVQHMRFTRSGAALTGVSTPFAVESSVFTDNSTGLLVWYASATVSDSRFVRNDEGVTVGTGPLTVTGSSFVGNTQAVLCDEGDVDVRGSRFARNAEGLVLTWCTGSVLEDNELTGNGTALRTSTYVPDASPAAADRISGNTFVRNTVAADLGVNAVLTGNAFTRNTTALRSVTVGTPFEVVRMEMADNRFERNVDAVYLDAPVAMATTVAVRNSRYGIWAPDATDLGGNVAWGNGVEPQCTGVVCTGH